MCRFLSSTYHLVQVRVLHHILGPERYTPSITKWFVVGLRTVVCSVDPSSFAVSLATMLIGATRRTWAFETMIKQQLIYFQNKQQFVTQLQTISLYHLTRATRRKPIKPNPLRHLYGRITPTPTKGVPPRMHLYIQGSHLARCHNSLSSM
jgi:hypothetical protein